VIRFRITKTNPTTQRDFTTPWDLGRRPSKSLSGDELKRDEYTLMAVSLNRMREAAVKLAAKYPKLGSYLSEVVVPDAANQEWDEDHADLRGVEPEIALGWVSSTVAIGRPSE